MASKRRVKTINGREEQKEVGKTHMVKTHMVIELMGDRGNEKGEE